MAVKLDVKDRRLLYELDIDSRQSASELARKVGISKQGCTFKINALRKKGVIRSFPMVVNTPLIGYLSFRLYFKLSDATPKEEEEFRDYLVGCPNIPWVVGAEGLWDYIAVVFPSDFEDFEKFSVELNNKYGEYICKKDLALVTRAYHFHSGYLLGEKKDLSPLIYAGQPKEVVELDGMEREILALLSVDSRASLIEMSRKLGLHPKKVSYRIEKLRKLNVIEGFITALDLDRIGFERYKVFIRTKNLSEKKERKFIQYARMHPHIIYYSKSIGANDVEIEIVVENSILLREVIADIRERFASVIKGYETLRIYREFKINYYPWGSPQGKGT
jgi:DNA-binding Lrp family transcriptional regulator